MGESTFLIKLKFSSPVLELSVLLEFSVFNPVLMYKFSIKFY